MIHLQSPPEVAASIAERAKEKRLRLNITQKELAKRSGVSLGSIKRFEQTAEIPLKHLIRIAFALYSTEDLNQLFKESPYRTTEDVIRSHQKNTRQRARSKP